MAKKSKKAEEAQQVENQEVENKEVENQEVEAEAVNTSPKANNTSQVETDAETAERIKQYEEAENKKAEDAKFLAESLKIDIGRRVKVVPFNTITWKDGTIVGIVNDKRSHKVLYVIKLDEGRRIVKAHNSDLIKKSDETVEIVRRTRGSKIEKLSDEAFAAAEEAAAKRVGTTIMYLPFKSSDDKKIEGKIISVVPDQRSSRVLYKIESIIKTEVEGEEPIKETKIAHKVSSSEDIEYTETIDTELADSFMKRREVRMAKLEMTPEEKVKNAEEAVKKAEGNIKKAEETLANRKAELEAAKKAFAESVAAESVAAESEAVEDDVAEQKEDLS